MGAKAYNYLNETTTMIKKQRKKKCVTKRKLKFEDCKHCLEATQLGNKINQLHKDSFNGDSIEIIKNS